MIRQPIKIGSVDASASGIEDIKIPVGHNGTICGLYFRVRNGAGAAASTTVTKAAVKSIHLEATRKGEGSFPILNEVTPEFLYFRELVYASERGVTNSGGLISYDPSAAARGGEAAANVLNIGTNDLENLVVRISFMAAVTGVTRIELYADIDYNVKADLGAHVRIAQTRPYVDVAGGKVEITTIPKITKDFEYRAFHVQSGALTDMTVSEMSLVLNGSDHQFRDVPVEITNRLLLDANRVPQTGFNTMDFSKEDHPAYSLPGGLSELVLEPLFVAGGGAAAGNCPVWYEIAKKA